MKVTKFSRHEVMGLNFGKRPSLYKLTYCEFSTYREILIMTYCIVVFLVGKMGSGSDLPEHDMPILFSFAEWLLTESAKHVTEKE